MTQITSLGSYAPQVFYFVVSLNQILLIQVNTWYLFQGQGILLLPHKLVMSRISPQFLKRFKPVTKHTHELEYAKFSYLMICWFRETGHTSLSFILLIFCKKKEDCAKKGIKTVKFQIFVILYTKVSRCVYVY